MRAKRSLDMSGHKSELENHVKNNKHQQNRQRMSRIAAHLTFFSLCHSPLWADDAPHSWSNLIGEIFVNLIMFLQTAHV